MKTVYFNVKNGNSGETNYVNDLKAILQVN